MPLMLRARQPASEEKLENLHSPSFNLITCKLIKDVTFISKGNETFGVTSQLWLKAATSQHWLLSAAFSSLGLPSKHRHHLRQSGVSCSHVLKGLSKTRTKSDYLGSEQEGLCVLVSTNLSNSKKRECHRPVW